MKLLIGGSPCTHWSIAQTKNRETKPEGLGWELFLNYLTALGKYQPDYFLYENNKSMSAAIREEITRRFGFGPVEINSALVSAQNRQRLYWVGRREPDGTYSRMDVEEPEDRGILLRDILESGVCWREKAYTLDAHYYKTAGVFNPHKQRSYSRLMAAEPVNITADGKAQCLRATYYKDGIRNMVGNTVERKTCVAEPVRIGTIESAAKNADFDSQQYRVYSPDGKSVTLCGQGGGVGAKTGLYAVPCAGRMVGRRINSEGHRDDYNESLAQFQRFEINENPDKTNCLSTVEKDNLVITAWDGKTYPVYEVRSGQITIKGKQYPIKLADGFYIIRKLTVTECKRLQTVPDDYIFPVSDTQAYKMLGNGWTVDVIAHLLGHIPGISEEPVEVLSMYDGMSCGHIALDKLGANVTRYYATEIDKYAIQTTQANFPETIQLGNAFQVLEEDWKLSGCDPGREKEGYGMSGSYDDMVKMIPLPQKRYSVIYADPPWEYRRSGGGRRSRGLAKTHYPTMTTAQIMSLPVRDICGEGAACFLWATFPNIAEALKVMDAWGFEYKTAAFVWVKKYAKSGVNFWGMGTYTRANAEVCLLGVAPGVKARELVRSHKVHQIIEAPFEGHSRKPDEVRRRIVQLLGDVPRIELFARERAEGWDAWGDEV